MWVDPLEIRNRPLHPHSMRHIKRCIPMMRPKGGRPQRKSYHRQNGPHLTIHYRPRRWSMKALHQFHFCMLLWPGILDLEMPVYHWQDTNLLALVQVRVLACRRTISHSERWAIGPQFVL